MQLEPIIDIFVSNQAASTVILIVTAVVIRVAVDRYLRARNSITVDQRRRIVSNLKNVLFFIIGIGLFFIWAPALRTFALSLTAFAVAIILATKELILCISGTLLKTTSGSMRVGDWIAINTIRGEVIDQTLMTTTVQELGTGQNAYEFTGRTITLPNSLFLSSQVTNEQFYKHYVIHSITLISDNDFDPAPVIKAMRNIIHSEIKDNQEIARRYKSRVESRASISLPDIEGDARLTTTNEGRLKITINCFLPTKSAIAIEQKAFAAGLKQISIQRTGQTQKPDLKSDGD